MVGLCFPRANPGPASFSLGVSPPADRTSLCGLCWVGWLTPPPLLVFLLLPLLPGSAGRRCPMGSALGGTKVWPCWPQLERIYLSREFLSLVDVDNLLVGLVAGTGWEAWVGRCPVGEQEGPWPSAGSSAQIEAAVPDCLLHPQAMPRRP